jgi:hypothetical protein
VPGPVVPIPALTGRRGQTEGEREDESAAADRVPEGRSDSGAKASELRASC